MLQAALSARSRVRQAKAAARAAPAGAVEVVAAEAAKVEAAIPTTVEGTAVETACQDIAITATEIARKEVAMEDVLGNTLQVGDIVAYPGRRGSSLWINTAEIVQVEPQVQVSILYNHSSQDTEGRRTVIDRTDRFVRIAEAAHAQM